jgi:hypothetical protein
MWMGALAAITFNGHGQAAMWQGSAQGLSDQIPKSNAISLDKSLKANMINLES